MDLLEESIKKKSKKSTAQKVVLTFLIISIILAICIICVLYFLGDIINEKKYSISINGKTYSSESIGVIELEDGSKYLSIKDICQQLDYKYFNGEYKQTGEDKDKGYITNEKTIVQFFANSNEIYKNEEDSHKGNETYKLANNIYLDNDTLYINAEDLRVAFNVLNKYNEKNNQTVIMTTKLWKEQNIERFEASEYKMSELPANDRAIAYGYVVLEKEKFGIYNLSGEEIIGAKYKSIEFIEYNNTFIVSNNNNKYGVIDSEGKTVIELQYDSLEVVNYNPLLYKVQSLNKYGVLKEDGSLINEINYTSIGYEEDLTKNIYYTLIIPKLNENIPQSIVASKNNLYGLIELETGKEIVPFTLKGIFLAVDVERDLKEYVVELESGEVSTLVKYVEALNQITARINN